MAEPDDDPTEESGLNDRLLDVFVFLPVGVAVAVVEELPRLAARGRERIGVAEVTSGGDISQNHDRQQITSRPHMFCRNNRHKTRNYCV